MTLTSISSALKKPLKNTQEYVWTPSHKSTETLFQNHSTLQLSASKIPPNMKIFVKVCDILKSTVNLAELYLLITKFLVLIENDYIHKIYLLNFLKK
jgi:hypothetical protein